MTRDNSESSIHTVVVTFNGSRWIEACLKSLQAGTLLPKIIVIDNGSTDGTADIVSRQFPQVDLVRSPSNLGFGGGCNIGMARALANGAEAVFLLNQDATVAPETLARLTDLARAHPEYGILSPVHLDYDGNAMEPMFAYFAQQGAEGFLSDLYLAKTRDVYSIPFVPAAAWLMSRTMLLKVGGFDPLFHPAYGEDDDYSHRALFHGFKIGIAPEVQVRHHHSHMASLDMTYPRYRSLWTVHLKRPGGSFAVRCFSLLRLVASEMASAALYLSGARFAASLRAFLAVLLRAGTIFRHRKISETQPAAWLEIGTPSL